MSSDAEIWVMEVNQEHEKDNRISQTDAESWKSTENNV
jgi:hypothetical protein